MISKVLIGLTLALTLASSPRMAAASDSPVTLNSVAQVEILTTDADGKVHGELVPAERVVPGDTVVYSTTFSNQGEEAATGLVINNPVPEHMSFLDGSAFGSAEITYSVDGGERYALPDQLQLLDAQGRSRLARAEEYTHIRWTLTTSLLPGQAGVVGFRARLN